MKFPASYYLHDGPNIGIEYNNTQSEDISIDMLFQGKPFGHQLIQDEMVNRKKKTIVINDWNPKHLENRDFLRYIDELIGQGFSILQADGESFISIFTTSKIKPNADVVFDPGKLRKMLASQRPSIAFDEAMIIDYDVTFFSEKNNFIGLPMGSLLSFENLKMCRIDHAQYKFIAHDKVLLLDNFNSPIDDLKMLEEVIPFVKGVMIDDDLDAESIDFIQSNVPVDKLYYVSLPNNINTIGYGEKIEIISEKDSNIDLIALTDLSNIQELILVQCNLAALNGKVNKLKKLALVSCHSSVTPTTIASLESLHIISSDPLIAPFLIAHARFIKHLRFRLSSDLHLPEPIVFEELIFLQIDGNYTQNVQSFANLLAHTPQLEELELNTVNLSTLSNFIPGDFSKLKTLVLSNVTLSIDLLSNLLSAANNLEKLVIKGCYFKKKGIFSDFKLAHLEDLVLDDTDMNLECLSALLSHAPALNYLSIDLSEHTGLNCL